MNLTTLQAQLKAERPVKVRGLLQLYQAQCKRHWDALKAKHPYPGGWRADTRARAIEDAFAANRGRRGHIGKLLSNARLQGAEGLYPSTFNGVAEEWTAPFDVKTYDVNVVWPLPPAPTDLVRTKPRAPRGIGKIYFTKFEPIIHLDGEAYALPFVLRRSVPNYRTLVNFLTRHSGIRRVKAHKRLFYYHLGDFENARANLWRRETAKS